MHARQPIIIVVVVVIIVLLAVDNGERKTFQSSILSFLNNPKERVRAESEGEKFFNFSFQLSS
jgi:ABC-type lipoprotein release transport system permease subunit